MSALPDVLASNDTYVQAFGARADLPPVPARRLAVLTCMDCRLDPLQFLGLDLGDAHVLRNAGGRASDDAIRSLVVSHDALGTNEWLVIHHTACGMESLGDDLRRTLADHGLDPLAIDDPHQSVVDDVARLRRHPLVPPSVAVHGFLYDVETGRLTAVS